MKVLAKYEEFNNRRYGQPWVALVGKDAKINFKKNVGGYTGGKGEAGALYIADPQERDVYAFGQKDYRGGNGGYSYVQYICGEFVPVLKENLIDALCD